MPKFSNNKKMQNSKHRVHKERNKNRAGGNTTRAMNKARRAHNWKASMGNNTYPKYAPGYNNNTPSSHKCKQSPTSENGTPKSKRNPFLESSDQTVRRNKQRNLHRQITQSRANMFDSMNLPDLDEYDTIIYGKKTFNTADSGDSDTGNDLKNFTFRKEKKGRNHQLIKKMVNITAENIDNNYIYSLALKGILQQVMKNYENTEHSVIASKILSKISGRFFTMPALISMAKELLPEEREEFKSTHSCSYILTDAGEKVNRQYFPNKRDKKYSDFGENLSQDKLSIIGRDLQEISMSTGGTGCTITTKASKLNDYKNPQPNTKQNLYGKLQIDSSTDQEDNDPTLDHLHDLTRDERDWIERDAPACKRPKTSRLILDEEGYPKSFYE